MKRIILSFFLVSTLSFPRLGADDSTPIIELTPFVIEGLGPEEARFISALIQSYLADIGEVAYDPPLEAPAAPDVSNAPGIPGASDVPAGPGIPGASGVPGGPDVPGASDVPSGPDVPGGPDIPEPGAKREPDFILSGSITVEQDSRVLALRVVKAATGETVYHTSTHKTTTDLTLKVRSLVEAVFSAGLNGSFREEAPQELITEGKIVGTWRGDAGVEIVRLQRGGRGIAILSSGAQMNLIYRIDDNTLRIFQISQNTERYYHPMPFTIARELSVRAEPWQYEFALYEDGAVLRGVKIFTDVVYDDTRIMELLPGAVREAEWTKTLR